MTDRYTLFVALRESIAVPGRSEEPFTWELLPFDKQGAKILARYSLPGVHQTCHFVVQGQPLSGGWRSWYETPDVGGKIQPLRHQLAEDAVARLHSPVCGNATEKSIRAELGFALAARRHAPSYAWTIPTMCRPHEARAYRMVSVTNRGMRTAMVSATPGTKWHVWGRWSPVGTAQHNTSVCLQGSYDTAAQAIAAIDD